MVLDGGILAHALLRYAAAAQTGDALVDHLNGLDAQALEAALMRCCGSTRWAQAMAAMAPFTSRAQLFGEAENQWWRLAEGDWREAFTHHPKIGADVASLRESSPARLAGPRGNNAACPRRARRS